MVWVGFDDNQPVGLSGGQAALPIWTEFMKGALGGRGDSPFDVPGGIAFADICAQSGKRPTPFSPRVVQEAFIAGSEPTQLCDLHR